MISKSAAALFLFRHARTIKYNKSKGQKRTLRMRDAYHTLSHRCWWGGGQASCEGWKVERGGQRLLLPAPFGEKK